MQKFIGTFYGYYLFQLLRVTTLDVPRLVPQCI